MFERFKRAYRSFFDNPANWAHLATASRPPAAAGVPMDETTCLAHLPIYAAVNKIATDMSVLDIALHEHLVGGGRRRALGKKLNRLLTFSPDGMITARSWRKTTVGHVLTWGNSYSELEFNLAGEVIAWHLMHPDRVEPLIENDELKYQYTYPAENGGGTVKLPAWKVLHFAGLSYEGIKGYSPIALARETLALGRAVDLFGAAFFGNAARPSGVLTHPGKLSEQARANLRESFNSLHGGPMNTGRIVVAEEAMKFETMTIPPEDAQFLGTKAAGQLDVDRLYGIPSKDWGDLESQNANYLQSVLLGWCSVIESEVEFKCLLPIEQGIYQVRHDFKPLLRPNSAARAQYWSTAIQWGWANRAAAAEDEGLAHNESLRNYLLPLNFQQISPDGKVIPPPPPPAQDNKPKPPGPGMTANEDQTQQANSIQGARSIRKLLRAELKRALRRQRRRPVDQASVEPTGPPSRPLHRHRSLCKMLRKILRRPLPTTRPARRCRTLCVPSSVAGCVAKRPPCAARPENLASAKRLNRSIRTTRRI
jgi:HK97 family phage portal protein